MKWREKSSERNEFSVYRLSSFIVAQPKSDVHAIIDLIPGEKRMRVIDKALKLVMWQLQECKLRSFDVNTREAAKGDFARLSLSHWCDIGEQNDITTVQNGAAVNRPVVRYRLTRKDMKRCRTADEGPVNDMKTYFFTGNISLQRFVAF